MKHCWHRDGRAFFCCYCGTQVNAKSEPALAPNGHGPRHPQALTPDWTGHPNECMARVQTTSTSSRVDTPRV